MIELGIDREVADAIAPAWGEEMQLAILDLYRSAAQPTMAELGAALPAAAARPGLHIVAENDHFLGSRR